MRSKRWRKRLNGFLAAGLAVTMVVPSIPAVVKAGSVASDLFISEYIEGSSFNKAIELYNGTGQAVDLSDYTLELYANGATASTAKLALSGTLNSGETYVLYHRDAADEIKNKGDFVNVSVINFNGDDALVLKKGSAVIDSFGQVGARTNWGTDVTLVRNASITGGDTNPGDAFNRDEEWTAYPSNTFDYLGSHQMDGTPTDPGDPEDPGEPGDIPSIGEIRTMAQGTVVTIKGTVAAKLKNTISVQDETGGIAVRPTSLNVQIGDEVTLTGELADYRGLLQLDKAAIVEVTEDAGAPEPIVITGSEVGEAVESQLVTVHNTILSDVQSGSGWSNYTATDATGDFIVRDETASLGLTVGTAYDSITGIVQQFDNDYQIIPRSTLDVVVDSSVIQPVVANPASGTFVGNTKVTLTTSTPGAEILYTLDDTNPIESGATYATPIDIHEDTIVKAVVKTDDGRFGDVSTFMYTITEALQIHDLQGEGHTSPFDGQVVEGVEGIVTYKYELNGSTYYHIQTPDDKRDGNLNTSEAIVLYSGRDAWNLSIGDLVSVTGTVSEYAIDGYADRQDTDLKTTQINVRDDRGGNVKKLESNVPLPTPFIINEGNLPQEKIASHQFAEFDPAEYAADFWESREAMLVQVGNVKAVGPQEHGDLVTVLENAETETLNGGILLKEDDQNAERVQFRLEPNGPARDFEVATGDRFAGPIKGVVGYSFQNYKIYTSLSDMQQAHSKGDAVPEKTTIVKEADKLTIASYNLENFSNNKSTTSDDKAKKLARAFVQDMQNPDIIGVTEVQDNNGPNAGDSRANESYERLIQAIVDAGGVQYEYVNIDPMNNEDGGQPNANIRVGFLYNPDRVSLTEGMPKGDATTAAHYENGKLTLNPGRIAPNDPAFDSSRKPLAAQFDFQGESIIAIVNHWNSKTGDTPLFGAKQPPVYGSEAQRKQIAQLVYDFISEIKADNPDANIVSLGDFNDFQFAEPLKIHEGSLMTNMINLVDAADRYSYVHQGNSQVLDHILVSNNLVDQTEIDILHINADFTDMAGRASDHDPVMVQIGFEAPIVWEPVPIQKEYNLINEHKKQVMIAEPSVSVYMDAQSSLKDGVYLKGDYAELSGEGFKTNTVILQPKKKGLIVDMKGTKMGHVIVEGSHPLEIRGAENIEKIDFVKGADASEVIFYNSKGKRIGVPTVNNAPVVTNPIPNQEAKAGETISIVLSGHFSDPDGDKLTYSSTKGAIDPTKNVLTLQLEEGSHIVGVTATDGNKSVTASFSVIVTKAEVPADGYYKDAIGKEGQELKAALHDIISDHRKLSYAQVWDALKETDKDPNNPNNVILFYSGESRSKDRNGGNVGDWNREHVWAKSHGDFGTSLGPGTDIHHLRPTDVQVNSARGNLDFDYGGNAVKGCDGCFRSTNSWEPPDRVKGDVARMLFYMATRYEAGDKVDLELNELLNNGSNPYHGKLTVLLEWHEKDPVDAFEMNRNNSIEQWQGNRNPFIDHPEWVQSIWKKAGSNDLKKAS